MGIIICQKCNCTIDHVEDSKVRTLYSKCPDCKNKKENKK
ncbi:SR1 protein [Scopulibacillus darangshiensis]|uniref:SR1 protein n=1 Tax=Scopulibacillus darangshiensis TaxID=442528 RepID=A0A4R2P6J5_9BACL|nr:GapA-binding peptide SR1P [Scopulibacillus darangshiensis]TCP30520.1 SR1 protein [Scopulibacillus darangshiensis]